MSIEISSVDLNFGNVQILKNINFKIEPGKIVTVVGPNGAGKSSLLNVISGNIKPSNGEVFYNNVPLKNISIIERATIRSVIGQYNQIVYDYSVRDILEMGWISEELTNSRNKQFEENLKLISEKCYLNDLLDKKLNKLSGGEQRRVHFARGLMQLKNTININYPKYFLLDEPISNMDIYYELQVMQIIRKIADLGVGVLLIIHDLNLASKFSDQIILMSKSKIIKSGIPSQVFEEKILSKVYGLKMTITSDPLRIYYY